MIVLVGFDFKAKISTKTLQPRLLELLTQKKVVQVSYIGGLLLNFKYAVNNLFFHNYESLWCNTFVFKSIYIRSFRLRILEKMLRRYVNHLCSHFLRFRPKNFLK